MYNPAIAKFLSVDPLAPSYPWYTPYQFAGNMPIWAVDLDGLEPLTMIDKYGRLTKPVLKMLNVLFNYDEKMLSNISFTKDANPSEFAATVSSTRIKTNPGSNSNSENLWLRTISHEIKHVEQYLNAPFELYSDIAYIFDKSINGYKGTSDEIEAFAIGDIATEFASLHNPEKILRDNSLTEAQKTYSLLSEVYRYKYNKLLGEKHKLNTELNNQKDKTLQAKILEKITNEIDPKLVEYEENVNKYDKLKVEN